MAVVGDTRYVARWMIAQYVDPETGEGERDLDKYGCKVFTDLAEAGRYGCSQNCYGSECFVEEQELCQADDVERVDYGRRLIWRETGEWLFCDGEMLERIYPEY